MELFAVAAANYGILVEKVYAPKIMALGYAVSTRQRRLQLARMRYL
jgi:hypothetical protein